MEDRRNNSNAEIAQLVEQRFRKAWVVGSSPTFGSDKETQTSPSAFFCLLARWGDFASAKYFPLWRRDFSPEKYSLLCQ